MEHRNQPSYVPNAASRNAGVCDAGPYTDVIIGKPLIVKITKRVTGPQGLTDSFFNNIVQVTNCLSYANKVWEHIPIQHNELHTSYQSAL